MLPVRDVFVQQTLRVPCVCVNLDVYYIMRNDDMQALRDRMCYVHNPRRDHVHTCQSRRDTRNVTQ
jgi:hypothetical protein